MIDQLRQVHVPVWRRAVIHSAGKLDAPVRCDQTERIPAPRAPSLSDPPGLEDDVVDVCLLEVPAGGETRLAGANDRDVDAAFQLGEVSSPLLLDQVSFRRLDLHPARLEVGHASIELFSLSADLEQHPALITRDVGPADVGHDLELLAEVVDHRLFDHVGTKDQLQPPAPHTAESKPGSGPQPPPARSKSRPWRRLPRSSRSPPD